MIFGNFVGKLKVTYRKQIINLRHKGFQKVTDVNAYIENYVLNVLFILVLMVKGNW